MNLPNGFTQSQIAGCITGRRLELTILPTEKCNFRCTYCYEDFALGKLPAPLVDGIINLIERRAKQGLENLSLSWFGGEPLLAAPIILRIAEAARRLSQIYGFSVSGGATTNGYLLTRPLLEKLVQLNQNYFQISIDGWGECHDRTRRRADGAGTFREIWTNLMNAHGTTLDFEISLRIHVTDINHDSLRELARQIRDNLALDRRFSLNFQDVRDLGGAGGQSVVSVSPYDFRELVRELTDIVYPPSDELKADAPLRPAVPIEIRKYESAGSRAAYSDETNYICYAAKPNHFLIRSNGRVGKCTVALDDPRNDIGFLRPDGTIEINADLARAWSRGLETMDPDQLGCPIAFWTKNAGNDPPHRSGALDETSGYKSGELNGVLV